MLAYLAVTGHPQSREVVAALLWPEFDIDRSRAALRRTLSTLRSALGDRHVSADRTSIALDLDGAWFDLAEFRRAVAAPGAGAASLAAAVDLHRGDLLDGFFIRSSAAFDDWLELAAEAIRQERAAALDRLVDALAAAGRNEEAVARAEQRLALDPLHEPAHRRLIERYAASGRRADAMRQYRECVRILDRELGVRPLSETTELYNAVNEGRSPAVAAPAPTVTAPPQPLVGRERPWRRLTGLHAGIETDGRMAVIEGESGVGKTRLADELVAALRAGGAPAIAARPSAGERGLAYGVVAQLLRAALGLDAGEPPAHAVEEAARLLPELGPGPPASLEDPGARLRFLEAVCQLVARAGAADAPGVVLVDDLHWCDPASLDALGYLGRRLDGRRLLLLLTRRTDEPDPDRACARLAQLGERLPLGRLTRADVGEIAQAQGLGDTEADALFAESEGLPLFLAELLAAGRPAEATGVREAVESRLDAVSETAAQVLSAAAVIGRTFDVDTVRTASGRSGEEVAAALEELCARGLIVERDAVYDFGHERIRAAVDDRAGLARRRLLNGRVAEALALRHGYPSLVARHLELAGREDEAAAAYATAGDRARSLAAGAEALAHYRSALALGHPDPAALHEAIGDVHTLRGEYAAALAAYDAAAAHAGEARLGAIEHKIGGVHERRGEWEPAERHLREALDRGAPAARVQADRGLVAWRRGDPVALELCREALELAEAEGDAEAAARAHNILGLLGAGAEHFQRSLELSEGLPDPSIRIAGLNNLARARAAAGELDPAADLVREALRLVSAQGDRHREAALRNNLADTLHRAGREDEAMEELKRAVAIFAEIGGHDEEPQPGVWRLVEW